MATQLNLTGASAVLKDWYLDPLREQMNQSTPLVAELARDSEHVAGKQIILPLHVSRSEAVGARSETGTLPTAAAQGYDRAIFNVSYLYGRIELTLPVIKATDSDRASFIRALESETKGMMTELKEDIDRQLAANDEKGNGYLASVSGTSTTAANVTTVPLTSEFPARFKLRVGMVVTVVDANNAAITDATAVTVTAVTVAGGVATEFKYANTGSNPTTASTSKVVRVNTHNGTTGGFELVGLAGIVKATGTLQGIDPAVQTIWKASVASNGGTPRAISDDVLQGAADTVWLEAGTDSSDLAIVSNIFQRRKYAASLTSQKRFTNTLELKGGFSTITWNDTAPFLIDKYVRNDAVYMINRKHLKIYELADYDWMDQDGAVLSRTSNKAAYEATLYKYCQLATDKRNAHVLVSDLSES